MSHSSNPSDPSGDGEGPPRDDGEGQLPDFVLDPSLSYRELRLLQTVQKAVEAAHNVLTEHGDRCESHGCQICRNTRGLLWSLEMAHGSLESQLPVR